MRISEQVYRRLPTHLQVMFEQLPNPGADSVLGAFASFGDRATSQGGSVRKTALGRMNDDSWQPSDTVRTGYGDSGSAARFFTACPFDPELDLPFFYCAKASKADRGKGNTHPTVKPVALMRHLVKLVTPPGGVVLDPFLGSGTTAVACQKEGFDCVGIEMTPEYLAIARSRVGLPDGPADGPAEGPAAEPGAAPAAA